VVERVGVGGEVGHGIAAQSCSVSVSS
jgi:hypothetical protein